MISVCALVSLGLASKLHFAEYRVPPSGSRGEPWRWWRSDCMPFGLDCDRIFTLRLLSVDFHVLYSSYGTGPIRACSLLLSSGGELEGTPIERWGRKATDPPFHSTLGARGRPGCRVAELSEAQQRTRIFE